MPRVKEEYLGLVTKEEANEVDRKPRWQELDDLLGQAEPSNFEPLDMDMNDLLNFEPYAACREIKVPAKLLKQESHTLENHLTQGEGPKSSLRIQSSLPRGVHSSTLEAKHEIIDLTDETAQPEVKQEPVLYTGGREPTLNELRTLKTHHRDLPLPTPPRTLKDVSTRPDEHLTQAQASALQAAELSNTSNRLNVDQVVVQDRVPSFPHQQVSRSSAALAAKQVLRQDLGQRKFLKNNSGLSHIAQSKPEPKREAFPTPDSTVDNAAAAPPQSRRQRGIEKERQGRTHKSSYDDCSSTQATKSLGTTYLDDCQDLLPSNTPANHPHLISIASHVLPQMGSTDMVGLTLLDVLISILYYYASTPRDMLTTFLDKNKANHFFFMFSSRSDKWHSWSIEREGSTVTIGIERNSRPHNDKSQAPSNGQTDFYVQYQLKPCLQHISPRFFLRTALMPVIPTPYDFLFNTIATHGADQHVNYSAQHQPPTDGVRALAQYVWFSAFRASAMEAEFQVAYGRKVRYDSTIGRIRATYDYALKGAKTQALKRAQGLYNVPALPVGESKELSRKRKVEDAMLDREEEDILGNEVLLTGIGP